MSWPASNNGNQKPQVGVNLNADVIFSFPQDPPNLIIICGPCRVGTTALSKVFTDLRIKAHMQPIKSYLRARASNQEITPCRLDNQGFAVIKETFGTELNCEFFNPLEIMLRHGYPKKKLLLIPMVRLPQQTWASWKRMWPQAKIGQLLKAFRLTWEIKAQAEDLGIATIPYIHELIRDYQSDWVIQRLVAMLGISFQSVSSAMTEQWEGLKSSKNIYFYDDPPDKFISGIQERGKYEYRDLDFSQAQEEAVNSVPELITIYEDFHQSAVQHFFPSPLAVS